MNKWSKKNGFLCNYFKIKRLKKEEKKKNTQVSNVRPGECEIQDNLVLLIYSFLDMKNKSISPLVIAHKIKL